MSGDYCEYPSFYDETFPKARKVHRCCECAAPIEVGEKHLYWRGHWPGVDGFDCGRQHMDCRELCMSIRDKELGGECFGFGDLKEFWSDNMVDPELRSLKAKVLWRERKFLTRRKWVSGNTWRYRKWGEPWPMEYERGDL